MAIQDSPSIDQLREWTKAEIAHAVRNYDGSLELKTSDKEIGLFGSNGEIFFKRTVIDPGLSEDRELDVIQDVISGAERGGYSPSLFNRILLGIYVPGRIPLKKH